MDRASTPPPPAAARPLAWGPLAVGALLLAALVLVFYYAPRERPTMGEVQRIFYFHVGFAFSCLILFVTSSLASLGYVVTRATRDYRFMAGPLDRIAAGCAEIGVVAGAIVLITGPLWAKPAWGAYWSWEPRLVLMLLTEFLFIGYLVLRAYSSRDDTGKRLAAGVAILAGPAIYFIHVAVEMWGGNHPTVVGPSGEGLRDPAMQVTFWASVGAVLVFSTYLVYLRYERHRLDEDLERAFLDLSDLEDA